MTLVARSETPFRPATEFGRGDLHELM